MCSLSWLQHAERYDLFFNRDERKSRQRALPPQESVRDGVRFLAPRDADAGGTWLLANERGLTLALLNLWTEDAVPPVTAQSRGQWLLRWASLADAAALAAALDGVRPMGCGPFTLAAFDCSRQAGPRAWRWDGRELGEIPAVLPLCSSSFAPAEVIAARQASFARLPDHGAEALWRWHSEEATPDARTTRMLRPDAQTWGISRISVGPERIDWLYREEMPDLAGPPVDYVTHLPLTSR